MEPARSLLLLLIIVFLLATSCGSPPEDSSPESGSSKSSDASEGSEAAAAGSTTTEETLEETTLEETTSAPATTMETTTGEAAKGGAPEKGAKGGSKPKRKPTGKVVEVGIRGLMYLPGPVKVSPGTTVRWTNEDQALHTVTSEDPGGPLRSKELGKGGAYEYTFRAPGQYDYYCTVHPFMKSGVTVE